MNYEDVQEELREAVKRGNLERVKQLLPQLQPTTMDDKSIKDPAASHHHNLRGLINEAASNSYVPIVKYLLSAGAPLEGWMGGFCIEYCDNDPTEVLEVYLQNGWDINADDTDGTAVIRAIRKGDLTLLTWLLAHGADPNQPSAMERDQFRVIQDHIRPSIPRKPLEWASGYHSLDNVKLLVERGARPNDTNALHVAAGSSVGGRLPVLEYLLSLGMDINSIEFGNDRDFTAKWGSVRPFGTPLHYAEERRLDENVWFLKEHGADEGRRDPLTDKTPAEWREKAKDWRRGVAIWNTEQGKGPQKRREG